MSSGSGSEALGARIEEAQKRLREAAEDEVADGEAKARAAAAAWLRDQIDSIRREAAGK